MRHFVDRKTNGEQGPCPFGFRIGFVLLHDGHDHVTLVARCPGYADVELGIHGRRFRVSGTTSCVIATPPPPSGQHSPPRLLRMQRRFGHPVVRADVYDIQLREMSGEIFERHPVKVKSENIIQEWRSKSTAGCMTYSCSLKTNC